MIIIPKREITRTAQWGYLLEHFKAMKRATDAMDRAFMDDNAEKFIEKFVELQWHEKSVIVGSKRLMRECRFNESNLCKVPLMEYVNPEE